MGRRSYNRVGEVNYNNYGTMMTIIEYYRCDNMIVEFQDKDNTRRKCIYQQFENGSLNSPYDKTVYGIGYVGTGKYKYEKDKLAYKHWHGMLQRCYDPYFIDRHIFYKDCYVCEEWHNFQNFAEWFYENYYEIYNERMELDKDILIKGNKIYSPSNCVFVPRTINLLFIKQQNSERTYSIGVCKKNSNGGYQTYCCNGKNQIYLGTLNTERKAWLMYKINKELVIQSIAEEYKNLIPKKLYNAMYKYEVEIND